MDRAKIRNTATDAAEGDSGPSGAGNPSPRWVQYEGESYKLEPYQQRQGHPYYGGEISRWSRKTKLYNGVKLNDEEEAIEAKTVFAENVATLDDKVSLEIAQTATDAFATFKTFRLAVKKFYEEFKNEAIYILGSGEWDDENARWIRSDWDDENSRSREYASALYNKWFEANKHKLKNFYEKFVDVRATADEKQRSSPDPEAQKANQQLIFFGREQKENKRWATKETFQQLASIFGSFEDAEVCYFATLAKRKKRRPAAPEPAPKRTKGDVEHNCVDFEAVEPRQWKHHADPRVNDHRLKAGAWGNSCFQELTKQVLHESVWRVDGTPFDDSGIRRGPLKRITQANQYSGKRAVDGEDWQEVIIGLLVDEWMSAQRLMFNEDEDPTSGSYTIGNYGRHHDSKWNADTIFELIMLSIPRKQQEEDNVFQNYLGVIPEAADLTKYNFIEAFFRRPRLCADGTMPITSHSLQNIVPFAHGLGPRISAFFEYVEEHNILRYAATCKRSLFSHYKKIYTRLNQLWRNPSSRRAGGCDLAPLLANLARRSSTHS